MMEAQNYPLCLSEMSEDGIPPSKAAQFVQYELLLDATPALNLAGFATTFMEKDAEELMLKNLVTSLSLLLSCDSEIMQAKNITHLEAYPASNKIETRCINIIARLFNAPYLDSDSEAVGLSTLGSSEAIFVSVFAAKRRWQSKIGPVLSGQLLTAIDARRNAGKPFQTPNMVMHSNVHVCWKKAALYLEIEERYCYSKEDHYMLDPTEAVSLVDSNTILVCAILGSTYTGEYDDIQALNDLLHQKNVEESLEVNIHVDAAGGGFVVPFVQPALIWDFRLPLVCSINVSGHKCRFRDCNLVEYPLVDMNMFSRVSSDSTSSCIGNLMLLRLTYAAVGWVVWRSMAYLPQELIFSFNYCGSPQTSLTVNFSKSAAHVIGQYYQLVRLG